jgi:HAD superfamily hydrolase (TIGR01509 family)
MVKLISFDLDGVLVDTKHIHYLALNDALGAYAISWEEHLSTYDGLKTKQKLELLHKNKGLPKSFFDEVWNKKQKLTLEYLSEIKPNSQIVNCFELLKKNGYKIAVCSNSIRKTVYSILCKLNIIDYVDVIKSNDDVKNSKPHPEMYWSVMSELSVTPYENLILEDSPYGLIAANLSGSNVLRVSSPTEINFDHIFNEINKINNSNVEPMKWKNPNMNVLIPMAGAGSRFENAGYTFPKPLIDVKGKPMIELVVKNLNIDANFIYIVQKKHREKYNLDTLLNLITPNCTIIEVDGITEGAACTALLAKNFIDNDSQLFFANSDQYVEWDSSEFMYKMQESNCDGGIVTFESTHPKWSFVKVNESGFVTEVAEKNPISNIATVGYYWWKKGSDFVKYAEQMIEKNIRVNNEFYVCPVFNEAITDWKKIKNHNIKSMWGLGTPEDLKYYLENF